MPVNTDNAIGDFIANMKIMLDENAADMQIKKVYDEDVADPEIFPCLCISANGATITRRTLGSNQARFEVDIVGEVWYHHELVNPGTRKNEVMRNAWEVCKVIQQNATLNQWLTSTRAYIRSCVWTMRRSANLFIASARIVVVARHQTRYTVK